MGWNDELYRLAPEIAGKQLERIGTFNRGRTRDNGVYLISLATKYRPYYALWRKFAQREVPVFVRTLGVVFDQSVDRAFALLQNCNVGLDIASGSDLEAFYAESDTVIPFGKYKGKHLSEILRPGLHLGGQPRLLRPHHLRRGLEPSGRQVRSGFCP